MRFPITIEAETGVLSDSSGSYKLVIDTTGIPEGDYLIKGDGDEKTVRILSKEKSRPSALAISEAEKEIAAYKDKIEINLSATASESAESKGVVAWLTDFLGL
jgi:hypothetical protein